MGFSQNQANSGSPFVQLPQHIPPRPSDPHSAIEVVVFNNTRYVVKYKRTEAGRRWREWLSALACLVLFGVFAWPHKLRSGQLHDEAKRLRALKAQGVCVPEVFLETDNFMVMSYTGTDINRLLYTNTLSAEQRPAIFKRLVEDLAHFHQAGHWHGGAQARNITCLNQQLWRIDFEENIGNAVPLSVAQAYDLILLFTSLSDYFLDDPKLAQQLLLHYLNCHNNPALKHRLNQACKWLERAAKLEPLLSKRLRKKSDLRRMKLFAQVLRHGLNHQAQT